MHAHTGTHAHTHEHTHTYTHTHTHIYTHTHTHRHRHTHRHTHTHTHTHTDTHAHTPTHAHTHPHTHTHTHTYTRTHTHTHTHTHTGFIKDRSWRLLSHPNTFIARCAPTRMFQCARACSSLLYFSVCVCVLFRCCVFQCASVLFQAPTRLLQVSCAPSS